MDESPTSDERDTDPAQASGARPSEAEIARALELARIARGRARAPYSGFAVGAALLTSTGDAFPGCNVENASYGLTLCAERTAIAGWTATTDAGDRGEVVLVVIVTGASAPTAPCGACRQWLVEFAPDALVIAESVTGERRLWTVPELLPDAFDGASLAGFSPE